MIARLYTIELNELNHGFVQRVKTATGRSEEEIFNDLVGVGLVQFIEYLKETDPELYKSLSKKV